jgi:hypothetical protein
MVLNAEIDNNGTCAIIQRAGYEPLVHVYDSAKRARESLGDDIELHTNHLNTCPKAGEWSYR